MLMGNSNKILSILQMYTNVPEASEELQQVSSEGTFALDDICNAIPFSRIYLQEVTEQIQSSKRLQEGHWDQMNSEITPLETPTPLTHSPWRLKTQRLKDLEAGDSCRTDSAGGAEGVHLAGSSS